MVEVVTTLEETFPLFISVSDIPCITPQILRTIYERYVDSGKDACSTWVPASLMDINAGEVVCHEQIDNIMACPVGVNILQGDRIKEPQDELQLLVSDPRLAMNVNTRADLMRAEGFIMENRS
jgi:adenosylcobinamide-phosphate guanylyltransferase